MILEVLLKSIYQLIYFVGIFMIWGIILGKLSDKIKELTYKVFGIKGVTLLAFIGIPVHELSHAIMAVLFGHKLKKITLFQRDSLKGNIGYVEHQYNPTNIYQQIGNFFIGIAPIIGGLLTIGFSMKILIPDLYKELIDLSISALKQPELILLHLKDLFVNIVTKMLVFSNLKNIKFWIFVILAIGITSHMKLSKADIKGATIGIFAIFTFFAFLNMAEAYNILSLNHSIEAMLKTSKLYSLIFLSITTFFSILSLLISAFLSFFIEQMRVNRKS